MTMLRHRKKTVIFEERPHKKPTRPTPGPWPPASRMLFEPPRRWFSGMAARPDDAERGPPLPAPSPGSACDAHNCWLKFAPTIRWKNSYLISEENRILKCWVPGNERQKQRLLMQDEHLSEAASVVQRRCPAARPRPTLGQSHSGTSRSAPRCLSQKHSQRAVFSKSNFVILLDRSNVYTTKTYINSSKVKRDLSYSAPNYCIIRSVFMGKY